MVRCSKCEYNNVSGAKTCGQCGEPIAVVVSKSLEDPSIMKIAYTGERAALFAFKLVLTIIS